MSEVIPVEQVVSHVQDLKTQIADYKRWTEASGPHSKLGKFYRRVVAVKGQSLDEATSKQFVSIAMEGHTIADENFPTVYAEVENQFTPEQQEAARLFGHEAYSGLCEGVFYDKALKGERVKPKDLATIVLTKDHVIARVSSVKNAIEEAVKNAGENPATGTERFTTEQVGIMENRLALASKIMQ